MQKTKEQKALDRLLDQVAWVEEHGGDLEGYVDRYGSIADEDHAGDGGEAIYAADLAELDRCITVYEAFRE